MRNELEDGALHEGTHLEFGWSLADGDADGLDYSIHDATFGVGLDSQIGEDGWAVFGGGVACQHVRLDVDSTEFDGKNSVGPYIALQGGWRVTNWFEPCARADATAYLPNISSTIGIELGARIHVVDPAAVFFGWRYAH